MKTKRDPAARFTGASGFRPTYEARAYVYAICAAMLEAQYATSPENVEGWMFGGLESEADRFRVIKEIKRLRSEMLRRARKLRGEPLPPDDTGEKESE